MRAESEDEDGNEDGNEAGDGDEGRGRGWGRGYCAWGEVGGEDSNLLSLLAAYSGQSRDTHHTGGEGGGGEVAGWLAAVRAVAGGRVGRDRDRDNHILRFIRGYELATRAAGPTHPSPAKKKNILEFLPPCPSSSITTLSSPPLPPPHP